MSRRFCFLGQQPGSQELPEAEFEALAGSSVQCMRVCRGTSAWRMRAQWPQRAPPRQPLVWSARDL
eukprot:2780706-Prymnesium_polylepis.1